MIDLGFRDAIGLVVPDDPTPLVSSDHLSVSPWVFFMWKREAPEGAGVFLDSWLFFSSAQ